MVKIVINQHIYHITKSLNMATVYKLSSGRIVPKQRALTKPNTIYQVTNAKFAECATIYSMFPNLDKVTFNDNNHQTLTQADIQVLPHSLTKLCVTSRGMNKMDIFYNNLPNLESLDVRYAINPISDAISNLQNLKHLTVWWDTKDRPEVSPRLSACTQLKTLIIHTKKAIDLSGVLTWLPNLLVLSIDALCTNKHIPAIIFPDNLYDIPQNLEILEICTKSNIVKLPSSLTILLNLKKLVISNCELVNTQILNNIEYTPNLTDLRLESITSQEPIVVNTNVLHNIEFLYIGFNSYNICMHIIPLLKSNVRLCNPDFANNPNLFRLSLFGDCTQDFDNFPSSVSACKNLQIIDFMKLGCKIVIPDEITQLPNLVRIWIPYCFDISYMPHPDKWPIINGGYDKCHIVSDFLSENINKIYYSVMSPDCKCRNPNYYLNRWSMAYSWQDNVKCTCASPGLIDKDTGQILTFPPDMNSNTPNIDIYRSQVNDYIERHKFTYPDPHPLLTNPEPESAPNENP